MDPALPPFTRSAQLNHSLDHLLPPASSPPNYPSTARAARAASPARSRSRSPSRSPPPTTTTTRLPGQPLITLPPPLNPPKTPSPAPNRPPNCPPNSPAAAAAHSPRTLSRFLTRELISPELTLLASHLWVMTTQSHSHISALHAQKVKGREIIITESPNLHLVWFHDRVFIKPLPAYLLSHYFWTEFLLSEESVLGAEREEIRRNALGFVRTYAYLIRHESDLAVAQREEARLVPKGVTWERFCRFVERFEEIRDEDCSMRYHYGEIRLTRLNFYVKIFLGKWRYMRLHSQYGDYFARFYGPLLFVFGVLSVMLSAMQTEMAVEQLGSSSWGWFRGLSRGFSIYCLVWAVLISALLMGLFVYRIVDEWIYALRDRRGKKREKRERSRLVDGA